MKLKIHNIPEEGLDLAVKADADRWFGEVVRDAFREDYHRENAATLDLHILKTCENIALSGAAQIDISPCCARCLESFERHLTIPVHVDLAPDHGHGTGPEEDLNFAFYRGDEFDLAEILRETLMLEVPLRHLCQESCKGLCPRCGQNLNREGCSCPSHP